jgi:cytochrome P450
MIPKGAILKSSMDSMHKKPEDFSHPDSYSPERCLNNLKTIHASANGKLDERDHFNFGLGKVNC